MLVPGRSLDCRLAKAVFGEGDSSLLLRVVDGSQVAPRAFLPSGGCLAPITPDQGEIIGWSALGEFRIETSSESSQSLFAWIGAGIWI